MAKMETTGEPDRKLVQAMFNSIAPRYDLLNRILSFGTDVRWRKRGLSLFSAQAKGLLLDLGAGTGDLSRLACTYGFGEVVSGDFSTGMLAAGRRHNDRFPGIRLCACDAENLPFRDGTFDACCIAFAIRNFQDRDAALREIARVVRPSGELMIIEFSMPRVPVFRHIYTFYFFTILPFIGGLVSGNRKAYAYLPRSVSSFPGVDRFCGMIRGAGFASVTAHALTGGIAHIYFARR